MTELSLIKITNLYEISRDKLMVVMDLNGFTELLTLMLTSSVDSELIM